MPPISGNSENAAVKRKISHNGKSKITKGIMLKTAMIKWYRIYPKPPKISHSFSFIVKTEFESKKRFDQCGIVMYLDANNWLKASIEYENERFQHLGSVVTNNGYSDWATTEIDAQIKTMWYRFSRREDDYCIECSEDGIIFKQMRICHMFNGAGRISFGVYACSPEESSFKATFTNMKIIECAWEAHDGQQPD